ncbi:hypothetical protein AGOR_G00246400, partial [Albula goreensis]
MRLNLTLLLLLQGFCTVTCAFSKIISIYSYENETLTWYDARSSCRLAYTDLASFQDSAGQLEMLAAATDPAENRFWIGLYFTEFYKWQWSGGQDSMYRNWSSEEESMPLPPPSTNNTGETSECVYTLSGLWSHAPCSKKMFFVCMLEAPNSTEYFMVQENMSWPEAQTFCRTKLTDLANIWNVSKNDEVAAMVEGTPVWIGLYKQLGWDWIWSDQSALNFTAWAGGVEPTPGKGKETCVYVSTEMVEDNSPCLTGNSSADNETEVANMSMYNQSCSMLVLQASWNVASCDSQMGFFCHEEVTVWYG